MGIPFFCESSSRKHHHLEKLSVYSNSLQLSTLVFKSGLRIRVTKLQRYQRIIIWLCYGPRLLYYHYIIRCVVKEIIYLCFVKDNVRKRNCQHSFTNDQSCVLYYHHGTQPSRYFESLLEMNFFAQRSLLSETFLTSIIASNYTTFSFHNMLTSKRGSRRSHTCVY